jgi:serine/threonine protein kinase
MARATVAGAMSSSRPPTAPFTLLPGTPYKLTRQLGRSALGEIYEVLHDTFGSRYALKILDANLCHRADALRRFEQEAQLLLGLRHPSLPRALARGVAQDGRPYFVMELLQGEDLRAVLRRRGALGAAEACRLGAQALDALHVVHDAGYVHRDVKPENLLLAASGTLKVLDFSFAKRLDAPFSSEAAALRTRAGSMLGTPRYMSPEHLIGPGPTHATDQYAIGVVLFELIVGAPMMGAAANFELLQRIVFEPPPTLGEHLGQAQDPALEAALARALAKHPEQRFPSAAAMADALRAIADRLDAMDDNATTANPIYSNATVEVDLQAIARADAASQLDGEVDLRSVGDDNEPTRRLQRFEPEEEMPSQASREAVRPKLSYPPKPRALALEAGPRVDVRHAGGPARGSVAPQALASQPHRSTSWKCWPWALPAIGLLGAFTTTLAVGIPVARRLDPQGVVAAAAAARDRVLMTLNPARARGAESASASTRSTRPCPSAAPADASSAPPSGEGIARSGGGRS